MRIGGSTIAMTSQRKYSEYKSIQYAEYNGLINERVSVDPEGKEKSLFDQIKDAAEQKNMKDLTDKTSQTRGTIVSSEGYKSLKSIRELRMALLENIINAFARRNGGGTEFTYAPLQQSGGSTTYIRQTVESGFYKEEENTAFVSEGKVITKDGKEINFNVSFEMSRSFQASYESYSESTYVLCDPLVFNFEGNTADITDQKFMFDLDCDGKEEEIASLGKGSGFLALDKNGDGIINDGTELFGTKSGDGFADLAEYDEDGNGWIDEDDGIFSQLRIWTKNEKGEDELISLKDAGVGAINLSSISTAFSNTDNFNDTMAVIQKTGIFLYENGNAGTIQHIDFTI